MPSSAVAHIYPLSLHDALPIFATAGRAGTVSGRGRPCRYRAGYACCHRRPAEGRLGRPHRAAGAARVRRSGTGQDPRRGGLRHRRSEEHTSELQSQFHLVCRLLPSRTSTLFPYTTLFRSLPPRAGPGRSAVGGARAATVPGMRAVTVVPLKAGSVDLTELPEPPESDGPVLVKTRAVGVCGTEDRKSTRLNSSHSSISYAVFCRRAHLPSFPTRRSSDLCHRGPGRDGQRSGAPVPLPCRVCVLSPSSR